MIFADHLICCYLLGETWMTVHHNNNLLDSDVTALQEALLLQTTPYHNDIVKDIIKP